LIILVHQNCPIVSTVPSMTRNTIEDSTLSFSTIQDTDTEKNDRIQMISQNTNFVHKKKLKKREEYE